MFEGLLVGWLWFLFSQQVYKTLPHHGAEKQAFLGMFSKNDKGKNLDWVMSFHEKCTRTNAVVSAKREKTVYMSQLLGDHGFDISKLEKERALVLVSQIIADSEKTQNYKVEVED